MDNIRAKIKETLDISKAYHSCKCIYYQDCHDCTDLGVIAIKRIELYARALEVALDELDIHTGNPYCNLDPHETIEKITRIFEEGNR